MSKYPSLNRDSNSSTNGGNDTLFFARVKNILLSNKQELFKKTDGWADLGVIEFKPLYKTSDSNLNSLLRAKPLFSNIKQYPIKEEIVLILNAPSNKLNSNPNSNEFYYFPLPIGIWNSNHHNSIPDIPNFNSNPEDLNFGETFKENEGIKNLLPEEGDILIEGRFGNSIRFSSTTPTKKHNNNPWSDNGENGKPITIIRNGQYLDKGHPWVPTYEDINNDDSSIYLCSGQDIPIELSCKNLKSLDITLSNSFNSSLQILDTNTF